MAHVANTHTITIEINYNGTVKQQQQLLSLLKDLSGKYQWSEDYGLIPYKTSTMYPEIEIKPAYQRGSNEQRKFYFKIQIYRNKNHSIPMNNLSALVEDFGKKLARESYDIFFDSVDTHKWDYNVDYILTLTRTGVYPTAKRSDMNLQELKL
jgi:hypothetical protein